MSGSVRTPSEAPSLWVVPIIPFLEWCQTTVRNVRTKSWTWRCIAIIPCVSWSTSSVRIWYHNLLRRITLSALRLPKWCRSKRTRLTTWMHNWDLWRVYARFALLENGRTPSRFLFATMRDDITLDGLILHSFQVNNTPQRNTPWKHKKTADLDLCCDFRSLASSSIMHKKNYGQFCSGISKMVEMMHPTGDFEGCYINLCPAKTLFHSGKVKVKFGLPL